MKKSYVRFLLVLLAMVVCATAAFSQSQVTGNITGRAADSSGALIPGVEVSITSPAMIGGARTAVTDETGSYRFTLLPAGTYSVKFALSGFKTKTITDVIVTPNQTMTIAGAMEVASTSEEITVTSQQPAIDLEAATVGINWDIHKLDELPSARSLVGLNASVPGVFFTGTADVGGSQFGTGSAVGGRTFGRSGNNVMAIDGLVWCQGYADYGSFEEINFSTASKGADQANAGLTMQMIVKSGSNTFHGNFTHTYERGAWHPFGQANNIDANLIARGFSASSNKFIYNRQTYGDIGGFIKKDKLWFYVAYLDGQLNQLVPGYIDFKSGAPAVFLSKLQNPTTKLTYQLNSKMKLEASWPLDLKTQPYRNAGKYIPLEATQNQHSWATYGPNLKWTDIVSSKMTATAALNRGGYWWPDDPWSGDINAINGNIPVSSTGIPTLANANDVRRVDTNSATGATLGPQLSIYRRPIRWTWTGDVTRFQSIGGKNNEIKIGYTGWWTKNYTTNFGYPNQQIYRYASTAAQDFTNTTPQAMLGLFQNFNSVQVFDYPNTTISAFGYKAFYINDKINLNRKLTLTVGLRADNYNSWLPAQGRKGLGAPVGIPDGGKTTLPADQNFAQPLLYPYIPSSAFPSTTRFDPRISLAYDVRGNGKLAVKASYGRYTSYSSGIGSSFTGAADVNPNGTTTCTYNGWKGDIPFKPVTGNFTSVSCNNAQGGVGRVFSVSDPGTWNKRLDKDLKSNYLDEFTAGVDVGFTRDYSLRVTVVRKFDYAQTKTLDLAQPFSAYSDQRCYAYSATTGTTVTAVANNAVPSGTKDSGTVCAWSVPTSNPLQGKTDTLVVPIRPGEGKNQYTAYEFTFNKATSHGFSFLGSYDISMRHENAIDALTPNALFYRTDISNWDQALKLNGIFSLKYGLQWASTFSSQSGDWFNHSVQVRNAQNVNVTQTVALHVGRYPWLNLWDQRFSRKFKIRETRQSVEVSWELFNTTNMNTVTSQGTTMNTASFIANNGTLYRPTAIVSPRISQFGVKYKF